MGRTVTLVLLGTDSEILGMLPDFDVPTPWWQESSDVVAAVQERYGVTIDVLRLLSTQEVEPHGGAVTCLAQLRTEAEASARTPGHPPAGLIPVAPALVTLIEQDDPLRAPYARPDGPTRSLAWAAGVVGPIGSAVQVRTWNLSAIWRLESKGRGDVMWLKQLPGFLGSEPAALAWLGEVTPELAPRVLAVGDEGRELLADVPGVDLYGPDLKTSRRIVQEAHAFQAAAMPATDRLLGDGIADRRGHALTRWIRASLADWATSPSSRQLLENLDERMAAVADCGLPDTLVHGDANPGNARSDGERIVFLDWSECFIGHPGFDVLGLVADLAPVDANVVLDAWAACWRHDLPGSDPARALDLLRPIAALRAAAVYAEFVARIEPTERPYHAVDVPRLLETAVRLESL